MRGSWAVVQNRRGCRPWGRGKGGPCRGATVLGREKGGLCRSERDTKRADGAWVSEVSQSLSGKGAQVPRALALPPTGAGLRFTPISAASQDVCECLSGLAKEPAQEVLLHLKGFLTAIRRSNTQGALP